MSPRKRHIPKGRLIMEPVTVGGLKIDSRRQSAKVPNPRYVVAVGDQEISVAEMPSLITALSKAFADATAQNFAQQSTRIKQMLRWSKGKRYSSVSLPTGQLLEVGKPEDSKDWVPDWFVKVDGKLIQDGLKDSATARAAAESWIILQEQGG